MRWFVRRQADDIGQLASLEPIRHLERN